MRHTRVPSARNHPVEAVRQGSRLVGSWHSHLRDVGRQATVPERPTDKDLREDPERQVQGAADAQRRAARLHALPHTARSD